MNTAADELSSTFSALADPSRRAILLRLLEGEAKAGELAAPLPISLPAVSRHLRVLERARLVERRVAGPERWYRVRRERLHEARDWLDRYRALWETSLDRLARVLAEERTEGKR